MNKPINEVPYDPNWRPDGTWTNEERLLMIRQMVKYLRGKHHCRYQGSGEIPPEAHEQFFVDADTLVSSTHERLERRDIVWQVDYFGLLPQESR